MKTTTHNTINIQIYCDTNGPPFFEELKWRKGTSKKTGQWSVALSCSFQVLIQANPSKMKPERSIYRVLGWTWNLVTKEVRSYIGLGCNKSPASGCGFGLDDITQLVITSIPKFQRQTGLSDPRISKWCVKKRPRWLGMILELDGIARFVKKKLQRTNLNHCHPKSLAFVRLCENAREPEQQKKTWHSDVHPQAGLCLVSRY